MMERNEMIITVTRAQAGDNEALNTLLNEYYNSVYYFALKTVKDEHIAADITQETFVQVITYIGTLRDPSLFGSWLRSITYSRCTRYFSKGREVLLDEESEGFFEDIREDKAEFIPDEALDKAEFRRTVMNIIDELSDEQRAAVLMYYFDELSVKQIAAIQGVSEGTVKSRLNYARKYIKSAVESYEQRHGIRLHGALLPVLYWIFNFEASLIPAELAADAAPGIAAATGVGLRVSGTTQVASAAGKGIGETVTKNVAQDAAMRDGKSTVSAVSKKIVAKEAAKGAAKGAVKKAGLSLGAKIAAGVVATTLAVGAATGGVVALVKHNENKNNDTDTVVTENVNSNKGASTDNGENDKAEQDMFVACDIDGYVTFGGYEQDNDTSNGAEPIEWLMLAKEEGRALVVSKYALDCKSYNESSGTVLWEESSLRDWLNNDFYYAAFGDDEKPRILLTDNENKGTAKGTGDGDHTEDRVFLLSVDELEAYFEPAERRACQATEYATAQGANKHESSGNCMWWLRSSGYSTIYASYISYGGRIDTTGCEVDDEDMAVRPAMWVSLPEEGEPVTEAVPNETPEASPERDERDESDSSWNDKENDSNGREEVAVDVNNGVYVSALNDETVNGRWEAKLTFKELFEAAGGDSSLAYAEAFRNANFTKKITFYLECNSDGSADLGVDSDTIMPAMPEYIDAMIEYMCSPEVLSENEGFEPDEYDRWFASIGMTPEQYKDNLRSELNAKLDSPEAAEQLAAGFVESCTFKINGDTIELYKGSRKYDELYLEDGKLWLEGDNGDVPFVKQ